MTKVDLVDLMELNFAIIYMNVSIAFQTLILGGEVVSDARLASSFRPQKTHV
jgi:hypothetical protein